MDTFRSIGILPNTLAIPVYLSPEEQTMGRMVFNNFLHEEFTHQGIDEEDIFIEDDTLAQGDHGAFIDDNFAQAHEEVFGNSHIIQATQIGASIRELANEFALSHQRKKIRTHANEVDLATMQYDSFWDLMDEVFKNGITASNLIALFYFCADVLIRCARQGLKHIGLNLFKWAVKFILAKVCKWVHERGGWERALREAIDSKVFHFLVCGVLLGTISWLVFRGIKD